MQEGHLLQPEELGESVNEMSKKDYEGQVGVCHMEGADVMGTAWHFPLELHIICNDYIIYGGLY